jgi:ribonuclease R
MVTTEQVRDFFSSRSRRPLKFKEIASLMGLGRAETRSLKRVLRELVAEGEVVRNRRGLYGRSGEMELVSGYFEAHRDGYGFVVQEKPGERDLFIPPRATLSAMEGDRVMASVEDRRRGSGRIVRVLERARTRVAGTLEKEGGAWFVRPKHRAVPFDISITRREGARRGERVVAEIEEYPTARRMATGRVVKVLERPDEPRAAVEALIEEFGLPRRFPRAVQEEVRGLRDKAPGRRRDLRGLVTVTIDGERARDFDDAVSIGCEPGGYRLWVHIADVGHYVEWDTPLDLEARRRGTSVYFPDRVIPMLPKELSEDLCSLKPREDRPALTAEMLFGRDGARLSASFYPSLIRSDARMTYTSVRKIIVDGDVKERRKHDALLSDLDLMAELAGVLRDVRLARGSLDFDLPEPEVLLDVQGKPEAILRAERNFAHMMIEEFMIAANESVAEHLEGRDVPAIYRIHEEPEKEKLEDFLNAARPFGLKWRDLRASRLHRILASVRGKPGEEALTYLALRALKQARYSPENVGHFGLASGCYLHFTSPIRRYPDLVVHRILRELIRKRQLPDKRTQELASLLGDIAFSSSRMERLADEAERDVVDALRVWYMRDRVGEEFTGRIWRVMTWGMRVRLDDVFVEGDLHVSNLTDDFYLYDETTVTLRGRHTGRTYAVGQELTVRVDRVDLEEREIVFGL